MIAEPFLAVGPQGVSLIDRKAFETMSDDTSWKLNSYELDDVSVIFPAPDIAVIAYQVSAHLTVDGTPVEMNAANTTVWVRTSGEWQAVANAESLLGDPFGRDQTARPTSSTMSGAKS